MTRVRRLGRDTFASLHTRNYRLYFTGQIISVSGTWMQRLAQAWLILTLTHNNGFALGIETGLQFLPMLLIPIIILLHRGRSRLGPYVAGMIVFYIAAKLFEFFDAAVFAAGGIVSGHTLKHLAAAMAPACLLYALRRRRYHAARQPNSET